MHLYMYMYYLFLIIYIQRIHEYICIYTNKYPISYNMEIYPQGIPTHPTPCPLPAPLRTAPALGGVGGNHLTVYFHIVYWISDMCIYIHIYMYVHISYIYIYIHGNAEDKSVHLVAHSPNSSDGRRYPFCKFDGSNRNQSTIVNM